MKIIDAHLHLFPAGSADALALSVGHQNSVEHLRQEYHTLQIVHGVVMGNHNLELDPGQYALADIFHYCLGIDSSLLANCSTLTPDTLDRAESHLQQEQCCGIKLYPGYSKIPLSHPLYEPIYDLAARYDKPVAVHMGLTANAQAHLKYCHPLALDEIAADHSRTRFVMCHFGNPFLESAAAVMQKNPNVAADLSGLLEGRVHLDQFFQEQAGYVFLLKTWLAAISGWDRILFGTDWPIVNLGEYIEFIQRIVPENQWEKVFFSNANTIYGLGL